MPRMRDPSFKRGVAFLCQHSDDGAMGLLVNRLSEYRLGDVLAQMNLKSDSAEVSDSPVLIGGPVQPERGFVLHAPHGKWESSFKISDTICVTTSRDILVAIAEGRGPEHALVTLGYSGWSAGQIETELKENAWLTDGSERTHPVRHADRTALGRRRGAGRREYRQSDELCGPCLSRPTATELTSEKVSMDTQSSP